jgi:hypothetical protein
MKFSSIKPLFQILQRTSFWSLTPTLPEIPVFLPFLLVSEQVLSIAAWDAHDVGFGTSFESGRKFPTTL